MCQKGTQETKDPITLTNIFFHHLGHLLYCLVFVVENDLIPFFLNVLFGWNYIMHWVSDTFLQSGKLFFSLGYIAELTVPACPRIGSIKFREEASYICQLGYSRIA